MKCTVSPAGLAGKLDCRGSLRFPSLMIFHNRLTI